MEFIDENFLKKNGLTKITCEFGEEQVKPNNPKYNVSLELDEDQLFNFSEALSAQEELDEAMECKRELATMHGVTLCEGDTFLKKVDNYIEKKEKRKSAKMTTNPYPFIKYKIKHR